MSIIDTARRHRQALIRRENQAVERMAHAHAVAYQAVASRLFDLLMRMADVPDRQRISWLYESGRLESLLQQAATEFGGWAWIAESQTRMGQADVVARAAQSAFDLADEANPIIAATWDRLPVEAVSEFIGSTSDGSPLSEVFGRYGPKAAQIIEDGLTEATVVGVNPREAARALRRGVVEADAIPGVGESLGELRKLKTSSEVIARTEIIRAHRMATLVNYQANRDIVLAYQSVSARDNRTCAVCWATDGEVFPLSKMVGSWHPQCRCTWVPVIEQPIAAANIEEMPVAAQEQILGPARFELLQGGMPLRSMVKEVESAYGPQRKMIPLRDLGLTDAIQLGA